MRQAALVAHAPDVEQLFGQDFAHVSSRAGAAFDIALGLELFERGNDGGAGKAVGISQVSRGGQARSGVQSSFQDRRSELLVEPTVKGNSRRRGRQAQRQSCGFAGHSKVVWFDKDKWTFREYHYSGSLIRQEIGDQLCRRAMDTRTMETPAFA